MKWFPLGWRIPYLSFQVGYYERRSFQGISGW